MFFKTKKKKLKLEISEFLGNTIIFSLAHLFIRSQYMCLIIFLNNACSKYNMHTFNEKVYEFVIHINKF